MCRPWLWFCVVVLCFVASPDLRATPIPVTSAYAQAHGGTVLPHEFHEYDEGVFAAFASGDRNVEGAYFASTAIVANAAGIGDNDMLYLPILHASAYAGAPPLDEDHWLWRTGAWAKAEFYDELTVIAIGRIEHEGGQSDVDPVLQFARGVMITIVPSLHGQAYGNTWADFRVRASTDYYSTSYREQRETWDVNDPYLIAREGNGFGYAIDGPPELLVPLIQYNGLLLAQEREDYYVGQTNPFSLSMSLRVEAASRPDYAWSGASYLETARIQSLKITDLDGNYIPGSEHWQIIGSSGLNYSVQVPFPEDPQTEAPQGATPEPASLALAGLGAFALSIHGSRRRQR